MTNSNEMTAVCCQAGTGVLQDWLQTAAPDMHPFFAALCFVSHWHLAGGGRPVAHSPLGHSKDQGSSHPLQTTEPQQCLGHTLASYEEAFVQSMKCCL